MQQISQVIWYLLKRHYTGVLNQLLRFDMKNYSDDCANKETYLLLPKDHYKQDCDEFGARHEDNFLTANNCISSSFSSTDEIDSYCADMLITDDDLKGEVSNYPSFSSDEEDNKEKSLHCISIPDSRIPVRVFGL